MHFRPEIMWTPRYTWGPWWPKFEDALGGHDHVNLEAVIKQLWRCTGRWWSCLLGVRNGWSPENQLAAVTVWTQTYTGCKRWINIGGVPRGGLSGGGRCGGPRIGGRHDACWDTIHRFTWNCENVGSWVQEGPPRDETWDMRHETWETDWEQETVNIEIMQ